MTKQSDIGRVTKFKDDEKGDKGGEVKMKCLGLIFSIMEEQWQ